MENEPTRASCHVRAFLYFTVFASATAGRTSSDPFIVDFSVSGIATSVFLDLTSSIGRFVARPSAELCSFIVASRCKVLSQ